MLLEPGMQSLRMGKDVPKGWHCLSCPLTPPQTIIPCRGPSLSPSVSPLQLPRRGNGNQLWET